MKANRFFVTIGLISALIIFGLTAVSSHLSAQAQSKFPISAAGDNSTASNQNIGTLAEQTSVQELIGFRDQIYAQMLQPGWLHIRAQSENLRGESMGVLPDGSEIPANQFTDTWYFIDAQGFVRDAVGYMSDEAGRIVQVVTYQDGIWHNLTFNETHEQINYKIEEELADNGFAALAIDLLSQGYELEKISTQVDGKATLIYSLKSSVMSTTPVRRAIYDQSTGALEWIETLILAEDGSETVYTRARTLLIETGIAPSEQLLAYLK